MTIPRVWPAPFNLSTNWVGVNLRWKEEENMESKTQLAHYSTPLFFPSLRGPPKVWHHSWIQLSLKYLQLKYILIYIYCTSDVHTEEILFTSYSSCRLGRQNGQFSKGTYMYVLTSHCNNAPKVVFLSCTGCYISSVALCKSCCCLTMWQHDCIIMRKLNTRRSKVILLLLHTATFECGIT